MSIESSIANAEAYASHYVDVRDYPSPEAEKAVWAGVRSGFLEGERHALATPAPEALDELVKALTALRNETRGTLKAHEIAIRYDHGNSNWRCLEMALEMADKALARFKGGGT